MASLDDPISPEFDVVTSYDTKVLQLAKEPVCREEPYYIYVEVTRGDECAAGFLNASADATHIMKVQRAIVKVAEDAEKLGNEDWSEEQRVDLRERVTNLAVRAAKHALKLRAFKALMPEHHSAVQAVYKHAREVLGKLQDRRYGLYYGEDRDTVEEALTALSRFYTSAALTDDEVRLVTVGAVDVDSPDNVATATMRLQEYNASPVILPGTREWCMMAAEALISYGISSTLSERVFLTDDDALPYIKTRIAQLRFSVGFELDQVVNAFGSTGWDFMYGTIRVPRKAPHDA